MTITWYHGGPSGWERRMLEPLWAVWSQATRQTGTYPRDDGGKSQLILPVGLDAAPALGDGLFLGEGPDLLVGPLKAQLPEVQIITGLRLQQVGSPLDHWEVEAK